MRKLRANGLDVYPVLNRRETVGLACRYWPSSSGPFCLLTCRASASTEVHPVSGSDCTLDIVVRLLLWGCAVCQQHPCLPTVTAAASGRGFRSCAQVAPSLLRRTQFPGLRTTVVTQRISTVCSGVPRRKASLANSLGAGGSNVTEKGWDALHSERARP